MRRNHHNGLPCSDKLFVLGFAVNSDEMTMKHTYANGNMDIEFSLVNGHDLIMWSESEFIYDENDVCIGFEHVEKPVGIP